MADNNINNPTELVIRFESVVRSNSQGRIISLDAGELSYEGLWKEANLIAEELKIKLGPSKRHVSIEAHKAPTNLAVLIACWLLNWSYTFVDLRQPISRLQQIIKASNTSVLISRDSNEKLALSRQLAIKSLNRVNFCVTVDEERPYAFSLDTCYIMFTSGSTGIPKGVPITSRQVLRFTDWLKVEFRIQESDILTTVNPWYFDNSVFDIYMSLLTGSSLVLVDIDEFQGSLEWIELLIKKKPTVWFSVPSLLILLQSVGAFKDEKFDCLRLIIFGGEAYPKQQLRQLLEDQGSKTDLRSVYGPTETTCICSVTEVNQKELTSSASFVSLGKFPDFIHVGLHDTFILENGDFAGELILGGSNVTEGYVNKEDNLGKFALIPKGGGSLSRYYLSGDLVSYNPELGGLCFLGRRDNQIKRFGVRIELEEIESRIERECGTSCVADYDPARSPDLCVLFKVTDEVDDNRVMLACNSILSSYMAPRAVFGISNLPLNANGKKDRKQARMILNDLVQVSR